MKVKAKKSLGQNFLRDESVIENIIESADLSADDVVIEVGPGEGVLTKKLAGISKKVIAIEKDESLAEMTAHNFQFSISNFQSISNDPILNFENKVAIIMGDILQFDLGKILKANKITKYKVVANLPYYITSPILRYFLENELPPSEMIVMVQKEVAERIVDKPGQMSILAVSVQYYAKAEYLFTVKRDSFEPSPKVDSAVIRIKTLKQKNIKTINQKEETRDFFRIVKAGFSAKRKTLANNLSNSLHKDKKEIENILSQSGFAPTVRAQELSVEDWKKLEKVISHQQIVIEK